METHSHGQPAEPAWKHACNHAPSFMRGRAPLRGLAVYPFARSSDWYLLPAGRREAMLREHDRAGRAFSGVQPSIVAAFALGGWDSIVALESDELHEPVDIVRDLRATGARRHVSVETPFHTDRRISVSEVVEVVR